MESYDLLIVGGGINGTAIARDAAGRGLRVLLVERDDLAQHTSSASSKLIHGGLRYLEYYEFRLVREGLRERERLLHTAPHIVRPLRFVLPLGEGSRPAWMIRAGLTLYDLLGFGGSLPRSKRAKDEAACAPLRDGLRLFSYWDAKVDDARLGVLNAADAARRGATILTRTELIAASRAGDAWRARLGDGREIEARAIVNAAGPWVAEVLGHRLRENAQSRVRLIKGSHIVVPRLFEGNHAYILQQPDGRVVFAIAYEEKFTLIGTTDVPVERPDEAAITPDEEEYLRSAASRYFQRPVGEIVWGYSGVRALYDDGAADAKAVTRDYRLELDGDPGAPLLSVFGGKITTARALAEEALEKLDVAGKPWTAKAALPGGEDFDAFSRDFASRYGWLGEARTRRLLRAYGSRAEQVLAGARSPGDLGRDFGAGLTEAEIGYLREQEFARTADDILWRRTKLGLQMSEAERDAVREFVGA